MNWLRNFMNGRYGVDRLSFALLILSMLLTLFGSFLHIPVLVYVSYIPIGLIVYRTLSKNVNRRSLENQKFSMLISPAWSWVKKKQVRLAEQKTHRFFKCRNCHAELRLPKGKGKIIVTCPKCKTEFSART